MSPFKHRLKTAINAPVPVCNTWGNCPCWSRPWGTVVGAILNRFAILVSLIILKRLYGENLASQFLWISGSFTPQHKFVTTFIAVIPPNKTLVCHHFHVHTLVDELAPLFHRPTVFAHCSPLSRHPLNRWVFHRDNFNYFLHSRHLQKETLEYIFFRKVCYFFLFFFLSHLFFLCIPLSFFCREKWRASPLGPP